YHASTKTLYFSSNGHIGMGGFDIFSAKGEKTEFETPVNAGYPLNSGADDIYFTAGETKKMFYFVSNRPGIIGLKSETCCDDIFSAFNNFVPKFAVEGSITQVHEGEVNALSGVKITITDVTDGTEKIVKSDELSGDKYFYDLQAGKKYNIKFQKKDHFPEYLAINTIGVEESETFSHNIGLNKIVKNKAYTLAKIFYDYKSTALKDESKGVLDTLYALLIENPEIIIELSSHTDSIGSDSYNMQLSQGRAESCVNYLVAKGLPKERLIAKGYGRNFPIAPNTKPDGR